MGGKIRQSEWEPTGLEWGAESQFTRGMNLLHARKYAEARVAFELAIRGEQAGTGGELFLLTTLDRLGDHAAALVLADELDNRGVKSETIDEVLASALAKVPSARRFVVSPEMTFRSLEIMMRRAGFELSTSSGGDDPLTATWAELAYRIEYVREPKLAFRTLEVFAAPVRCERLVTDIIQRAYVSTLTYEISDYLRARSTPQLLFGLRAAEWLARTDHSYHLERVGKLRQHRDKQVAAAAKRVYPILERESGGPPKSKKRAARSR